VLPSTLVPTAGHLAQVKAPPSRSSGSTHACCDSDPTRPQRVESAVSARCRHRPKKTEPLSTAIAVLPFVDLILDLTQLKGPEC
jgi:hypothetical protein